jgi:hypothetical protein
VDWTEKIVEGFKLLYKHEFLRIAEAVGGTVKLVLPPLLQP